MKVQNKREIRNTIILNVIGQGLTFLSSIILIKLLSPDTYGLIGMVIPFVIFTKFFHSFGTMNSIISQHEIDKAELSSLLWGKLIFSLVISIFFVASIPLLVRFFSEERLGEIVVFFAFTAIISSVSEIYYGILYRDKNFLKIAKVELFAIILSSTCAILIAYQGKEIQSLIIKEVIFTFLILIGLMIYSKWLPWRFLSISSLRKHAAYGTAVTISSIASWASRSLDDIIIGRFFSTASLGIYTRAYNILSIPNSALINIALKLGIPMIARVATDEEAINKYKKILRFAFIANAPIGLILFFTCDIFVPQVFGDKWLGMIMIIKIFSILSIFQVLGPLDNIIFQGRGQVSKLTKYSISLSIILVSAIVMGYLFTKSIVGIAIFYALGSFFSYFIAQNFVAKAFHISQISLLKNLRYGFLGVIMTFVILTGIEVYFQQKIDGSIRYLYIILVPIIYSAVLALVDFKESKMVWQFFRSFIQSKVVNKDA